MLGKRKGKVGRSWIATGKRGMGMREGRRRKICRILRSIFRVERTMKEKEKEKGIGTGIWRGSSIRRSLNKLLIVRKILKICRYGYVRIKIWAWWQVVSGAIITLLLLLKTSHVLILTTRIYKDGRYNPNLKMWKISWIWSWWLAKCKNKYQFWLMFI